MFIQCSFFYFLCRRPSSYTPLTRLLHASYTPLTTGLNAFSMASGPALSNSNAHVVGDGRFGGVGGGGHALGGGGYGGLGVEELNGAYAPPAPGSFAAMAQAFLGPLEAFFFLFGPLEAALLACALADADVC
jgi:hypothetical protein